MLTWTENAHRELVADAGGYLISQGWKLPNVPRWEVFVSSPELNEADGTEVIKYRGSRDSLEDAKAFAEADYDARYKWVDVK